MRTTNRLTCCLLLLLWLPGCATTGPSIGRTAEREASQLWRAHSRERASGLEVARLASLVYLLYADRNLEASLLEEAQALEPNASVIHWRLARTASRDRRFADLLHEGAALLDADPDGIYTELAWRFIAANEADVRGLGPLLAMLAEGGRLDQAQLPANPATRDLLLALYQEQLAREGNRAEAIRILRDRGYVTRWTIAGPAGNDLLADFDQLPPLDRESGLEIVQEAPYVPAVPTRPGGGIYDAWAELPLDRAGLYLVSGAATSSYRIWVDGVEVVAHNRWEAFGDRQQHGVLQLDEGIHDIRVRVASDLRRASFSVQVRHLAQEGIAPATHLGTIPGGAVDTLCKAVEADPDDLEMRLDRVLAEAIEGTNRHGRADATELASRLPYCVECQRRAGLSILADTSLTDSTRGQLGLPYLRQALVLDPELAGIENLLARRFKNQDPEGAREMLAGLVERRPDYIQAHLELARCYINQSWTREAEELLLETLALAPDHPELLRETASFYGNRSELASAHELKERELEAIGKPFGTRRSQLLESFGRREEQAAELEELTPLDPYDESIWQKRVWLARAGEDPAGAAELALDAAARFPDSVWPHQELIALARARGDQSEVSEGIRAALAVDPSNIELRQELWRWTDDPHAWLSGDPAPIGYDPKDPEGVVRGVIEAFEADPGETADYPTVVLLDRREVQVFEGGASLFRIHRAVRLQDRPAVDAYAELAPGALQVIAARTWRTDGTIVDADPPVEKDAYSLRDLTPGCTIELQALVDGQPDEGGRDGAHIGPVFLLSQGEYVRHHEMVYLLPPGASYAIRGTGPDPETTPLPDGGTRLRWVVRDTEPPAPQPMAPMAVEYLPWVQLLVWTDLEQSLAAVRPSVRAAVRQDPLIGQLAGQLTVPGNDAATTQTIVAFVRENIRPAANAAEEAAEAVDILAVGAGSHSTLVLALLEAAGVEADLVQVRPRYLPALGEMTRHVSDYPYSLLRVVAGDDEDIWLDLSDPYQPVGWLHPALRDADVIGVFTTTTPLPPRTPAPSGQLPGLDAHMELVVDAEGNAGGALRLSFFAQEDALLREDLWSIPEADRLRTFDAWLAQSLPGVSVRSMEMGDGEPGSHRVTLLMDVEIPRLFQEQSGALEAPLLAPDLLPPIDGQSADLAGLVLGGDRTAPLILWPYHESLEIRLSGPGVQGRAVEGWEAVSVRTPQVELTRDRAVGRKEVVLTRETTIRMGRVTAEDYPKLRDLLSAVVSSGRNPLRLR